MNAPNPQFIRTEDGGELVVLTRREYDALLASAGDETAEDRMAERLIADAEAALADGSEILIPGWVVEAMIGEPNPFRALRKLRGKTQVQLSDEAGISQAYLSDLERGAKVPSLAVLDAISRALDVDPVWLRALDAAA